MKLNDVLKGKSEEDILSSIDDLRPNDLLTKSITRSFLPGIKKALEMGADVHAQNDFALRWASRYGNYNVVKLLLKYGADVHAHDDTALVWASANSYYNVVKLLLKNGANKRR
jgi:outer membrane receptor for ferric coprogen and ferric-rhodotorulic acid